MLLKKLSLGPILGGRIYADGCVSQKLLVRGMPPEGRQKVYIKLTATNGTFERDKLAKIDEAGDFTCVLQFEGLPENTSFNYVAGVVPHLATLAGIRQAGAEGGTRGSFMTRSRDVATTTFNFGSCRHPDGSKDQSKDDRCFKTILREYADDDLLLMCGDQIYGDHGLKGGPFVGDNNLTLEHYLKHYRKFFARPAIGALMAKVPTYMIFDDHEVKNGWSKGAFDRKDKGFEDPQIRLDALKAYDIYQASHAPGNTGSSTRYYYEFSHGQCDFFVMDLRNEREVVKGRMIHPNQMEAVRDFLNRGRGRVKFLVSPVPMFPDSSSNPVARFLDRKPEERWEGYPTEREMLLQMMRDTFAEGNNRNFFILSGDVHCSSAYRLTHKTTEDFCVYNLTSSAFNWSSYMPGLNDIHFAPKRPLRGNEDYQPERLKGKVITQHNFCRVSVTESTLTATFHKWSGKPLRTVTLPLL